MQRNLVYLLVWVLVLIGGVYAFMLTRPKANPSLPQAESVPHDPPLRLQDWTYVDVDLDDFVYPPRYWLRTRTYYGAPLDSQDTTIRPFIRIGEEGTMLGFEITLR